jgi:hypothetical protein
MNARAVCDGDEEYWERIIEDITGQRQTEEAERRAETLRAVNAAAHEINAASSSSGGSSIPHSIRGSIRRWRPRSASPTSSARMGGITRMETDPDSAVSPKLDLRRSDARRRSLLLTRIGDADLGGRPGAAGRIAEDDRERFCRLGARLDLQHSG